MLVFLKMLPIELEEITEYIDPITPIGYKERAVGTASNDLKKLYTIWKLREKITDQNAVEVKYSRSLEDQLTGVISLNKNMEITEFLSRLFWISLKDEFDLWKEDKRIGIRSGYTIVVIELPDTGDILRDMFFGPRG